MRQTIACVAVVVAAIAVFAVIGAAAAAGHHHDGLHRGSSWIVDTASRPLGQSSPCRMALHLHATASQDAGWSVQCP